MLYDKVVAFEELKGQTLIAVHGKIGGDTISFQTVAGREYKLMHLQDCCEEVRIEDIVGDFGDLIGEPLLMAEEASNSTDPPPEDETGYRPDSYTWTFYKLATIKGAVTIRWYGESNGYYSEEVDLVRIK